jgi:glutamate 5-kinase
MLREFPRTIKRLVVKVGSSTIATNRMKPSAARLRALVEQICRAQQNGTEVVLVSSGAIVFGMGELGMTRRPSELFQLQALAATGQAVMMRRYTDYFGKHKSKCAQVLLTWEDFDERSRYNNARNTFKTMLAWGIVPVVNENDTVATDEIKFGDNDRLSALVATAVDADLLLILSDVEGLYDLKNGEKKLFSEVRKIDVTIEGAVSGEFDAAKKNVARGGMSAKLSAIKIATQAKIPCVIADGKMPDVILRVLNKERVGTFFFESQDKLIARKHWISFGVKPKGALMIDDGARNVLLRGGKSLLLPGIVRWDGHFKKGDVVKVEDIQKQEIGRGIVAYSSEELFKISDKRGKPEAIHCDNLVIFER